MTERIAGYEFGPYWFQYNHKRISGMSGVYYANEDELVKDYDVTQQACGLVRVYNTGRRVTIKERTGRESP